MGRGQVYGVLPLRLRAVEPGDGKVSGARGMRKKPVLDLTLAGEDIAPDICAGCDEGYHSCDNRWCQCWCTGARRSRVRRRPVRAGRLIRETKG